MAIYPDDALLQIRALQVTYVLEKHTQKCNEDIHKNATVISLMRKNYKVTWDVVHVVISKTYDSMQQKNVIKWGARESSFE